MSTTNLFSNCTNHYPIEQYFLNCTNTSRPCELIHDFAVVAELLTILDFYISCILFTIAGILNVYFMTIVLPLYLKMSHSTQKRYVFVVSRCVSSISAALTLLILRCILYVYFPPGSTKSNYFLYAVVVIVNDISFYSLQGSYIGMAVLLYIGVIHPVYFSTHLRLRKIYIFAILNWILAVVVSVPTGLFQTAGYVPGPIKCDSQVCSPIVGLINFIIVSFAFLITIIILSFVFICLSFHIRKAKKLGSYTSSQTLHHARGRLGWTLTAIIVISLAEGIPESLLIGLKADNALNTCNNFYQADRLVDATIFTSMNSIVWALVLILDPLASTLFDEKVLSETKKQLKMCKKYYAKVLETLWTHSHGNRKTSKEMSRNSFSTSDNPY
ncbi:G-protein coupled receptors family 1 profile domain-containing protein [Caenorhabditis elegans]|uniref:G-protein coupled receptors family 1 profile domain-containing protein n=1 Tax=Caenorhabditis elegans TaxID=6239 RepID=G4RRB3_CAEEL|nr:G-protein coupled receptors family 1 profile domain-containing protein [Caenorhabditis elegans]CCD61508.2 G-protein coupled receptors family 1 profile domain-containing protein [Caenorhabditis elegans]|eukprot:NP_001254928.2 Uncharacterized protein CELE_B0244.15 [Caenorhabditis elegans]